MYIRQDQSNLANACMYDNLAVQNIEKEINDLYRSSNSLHNVEKAFKHLLISKYDFGCMCEFKCLLF